MKPLITTIIPTYRRPKLLKRAIQSVLNQTYPHFNVCVYDNHSDDETADVVREISLKDPRVIYECHPTNVGAFNNFQYGLRKVETAYFSFLSDDDVLLPCFFEAALEGFERFPEAYFSAGSTIYASNEGKIHRVPLNHWPRDGFFLPEEGVLNMLNGNHPQWAAVLFRKELKEKIGLLDPEVGPSFDLDFQLRCGSRYPFVVSKKICAIFVSHPASTSTIGGLDLVWPGWLKIIRNLCENPTLSSSSKEQFKFFLEKDLKNTLKFFWFQSMDLGRLDAAESIAKVLSEYFRSSWFKILRGFGLFLKSCPSFLSFFLWKGAKHFFCFFYFLLKKKKPSSSNIQYQDIVNKSLRIEPKLLQHL